jgi:hypothetical protein
MQHQGTLIQASYTNHDQGPNISGANMISNDMHARLSISLLC